MLSQLVHRAMFRGLDISAFALPSLCPPGQPRRLKRKLTGSSDEIINDNLAPSGRIPRRHPPRDKRLLHQVLQLRFEISDRFGPISFSAMLRPDMGSVECQFAVVQPAQSALRPLRHEVKERKWETELTYHRPDQYPSPRQPP